MPGGEALEDGRSAALRAARGHRRGAAEASGEGPFGGLLKATVERAANRWGLVEQADQVEMRLERRVKTERLTAFGEVLRPPMDGAGIATTKELLERAGKQHEPHAVETLLRHMYGPPTEVQMGYLTVIDTALGLGDSQEDEHQRTRLSTSLMYGTLRITDGAKVERDALGAVNRALSEASGALEKAQPRDEAEREPYRLASLAISEAGMIVAKEQRPQYYGRDDSGAREPT